MIALDDLLSEAFPAGSRVVAGDAGVDVGWAAALRSRAPGFEGLKGGELAIVSLRTLHQLDDRLTLARLIDQIGGLGVAAVAVAGAIDAEAETAAARFGMPLVQLPEDASTRELEQRVTRVIVDRRAELTRIGQDVYHQLMELVIAGRGSEAVVGRLVDLTGKAVLLEDAKLNLLAIRVPEDGDRRDLAALVAGRGEDLPRLQALAGNAADPPTVRLPIAEGLGRIVAPVGAGAGREGYLSIVGTIADLSPADRLAVSRGAAACAIDLARERSSRSDGDLRLAEVIDDLIGGGYASEAALVGRAQRLGLDLSQPLIALALRASGADGLAAPRAIDRLLRRELARRSIATAFRTDPQGGLALLPPGTVRAVVAGLTEGLAGMGGHLAAAWGRPASGVAGLRDAIRISQRAVDLAVRRDGPDAVLALGELGVDELLLALGSSPLLTSFRDEWLGRLAEYDAKNNTQLVATLAAYFRAHNSPTEASEVLHLHRNTLLYRLQRIREITGRDPDDPARQLAFHLAIRVGEVLLD